MDDDLVEKIRNDISKHSSSIQRDVRRYRAISEERDLSIDEKEIIISYLNNPTRMGIWQLTFQWNNSEDCIKGILEEKIWGDVQTRENRRIRRTKDGDEVRYIRRDPGTRHIKRSLRSLPLYFNIFKKIVENQDTSTDGQTEQKESITDISDIIIKYINIDEIKEKFPEAVKFFNEEVYYKGISNKLDDFEPYLIKNGNFIPIPTTISTYSKNDVVLMGLHHNHLEVVRDFLSKGKLIKNDRLIRFFTPVELIYSIYIPYLKIVLNEVIDDEVMLNQTRNAISEYEDESYSHCINTVGKLAENKLIQIYETLFRKEIDPNLTMGQIFSRIQSDVQTIIKPKRTRKQKTVGSIFNEIRTVEEQLIVNQPNDNLSNLIKIMRMLTQQLSDQNQIFKEKIDSLQSVSTKDTIFPNKMIRDINELLKYRNSTAHYSKMTIEDFEANRSIYCFITLYVWWNNRTNSIEWKKPKDEIIRDLVQLNS